MAESTMLVRAGVRAAAVLALAVVLGGLLPPPGRAVPDTTVRTVGVPVRDLLRSGTYGALRASDGEIHARTRMRTAPARVCVPIDATGLGVVWRQDARRVRAVDVAVQRDGGWSAPVHLDAEDEADLGTPDANDLRGSSFLWIGGARCARITLELSSGARVDDVAVVFVDSSGDPPSGAGLLTGTAEANAVRPEIVTREEWGADPDLMNCTPIVADSVLMGFVHHTAGTNAYTPEEADDVVRGVYAFHTRGRGWCDIGYNFLVDRFGAIYEGRSGGTDQPVVGAAQMGFNTRAFSVSVMGNFEAASVPAAVQRALVRVLAWRLDVAHVNPASRARMVSAGGDNTRFERGQVVRLAAVSGHRDTGFTACPGDRLYALLPGIRERVAASGLPKIWKPQSSVEELQVTTPTPVRIRARGSASLTWSVTLLAPDGTVFAELGGQRGERLDLTWPKSGPPAHPTVPGTYTLEITATDAGGDLARPASLPLEVVGAAPSPTPTPSPSPSPG